MIFAKYTAFSMLVMLLVWALPLVLLPIIFNYDHPGGIWGVVYLILPLIAHIAFIVFYYKKGYPLFALPVSHVLFPFFLLLVMAFVHFVLRLVQDSTEWMLSWTGVAVIYFFLFAAITVIISLILNIRRNTG